MNKEQKRIEKKLSDIQCGILEATLTTKEVGILVDYWEMEAYELKKKIDELKITFANAIEKLSTV